MKLMLLQLGQRASEAHSLIYRYEKPDASSRRIWLEKRNNKNMFKFLLCFYLLNCVSRKQSFIPCLNQYP